jgi:hypothetical protein
VGNLQNNKLYFDVAQDSMQVSVGFVANFDQGFQYIRVSGVKLSKQVNVFE